MKTTMWQGDSAHQVQEALGVIYCAAKRIEQLASEQAHQNKELSTAVQMRDTAHEMHQTAERMLADLVSNMSFPSNTPSRAALDQFGLFDVAAGQAVPCPGHETHSTLH